MNYATCIRSQGPLAEKVVRLHKECVAAGLIRDDREPKPAAPPPKQIIEPRRRKPRETKIGKIQAIVCEHYSITFDAMMCNTHMRRFVWPRQVAMAISRNMTSRSLPQIAHEFERDHTSVMHGCRVVVERTAANPFLSEELREVMAKVREALAQ